MKKILLIIFIFISTISFGSVKIINGKSSDEKSIVYKDNDCTLQLDYKNFDCVAITVKTSSFASETEDEVGFMVDSGYNRIIKLKKYFTENMIDDCFKIKFPFHYCNKEIFSNIVNDIFLEENLAIILDRYLDEMKKEPKEAQPININELVEVARNEINSKK